MSTRVWFAVATAAVTILLVWMALGDDSPAVSALEPFGAVAAQERATPDPAAQSPTTLYPAPGVDQGAPSDEPETSAPALERDEIIDPTRATGTPEGTLEGPRATLIVRTRDAKTGAPLAKVQVVVYEPGAPRVSFETAGKEGSIGANPTTDESGEAHFELPANRALRLSVRGGKAGASDASRTLDPFEEGETRELDVDLERGGTSPFHARLVDLETGVGIAGAELRVVELTNAKARASAWDAPGAPDAITEANGHFELARPTWTAAAAQVDAVGYGPATFLLTAGSSRAEIASEIPIAREATLVISIRTAPDEPREGFLVRVSTSAMHLPADGAPVAARADVEWLVETNAEGRATLRHLPSGAPLDVEVSRENTLEHASAQPVALRPGERREVSIDLGPGTALVGTLHDEEGEPVAGQELWLAPASTRGPGLLASSDIARSVAARGRSDDEGHFRFDDVQSGDWWVGPAPRDAWTNDQKLEEAPAPIAKWIHVPDGVAEVSIELVAHRGHFLAGHVVGDDGPIGFAELWVRPLGAAGQLVAQADPDGGFRVGPLSPGPYELAVSADPELGHSGCAPKVARAGDEGIELRLRPGASLRVSATSEEPSTPRLRSVVLTRVDGGPKRIEVEPAKVGDATSRELRGLDEGTYSVAVSTEDGRVGIARGIVLRANEPTNEVQVPVVQAASLALRHAGAHVGRYEVSLGGIFVAAGNLEPGKSVALAVPAGELAVDTSFDGREAPRQTALAALDEPVSLTLDDTGIE